MHQGIKIKAVARIVPTVFILNTVVFRETESEEMVRRVDRDYDLNERQFGAPEVAFSGADTERKIDECRKQARNGFD